MDRFVEAQIYGENTGTYLEQFAAYVALSLSSHLGTFIQEHGCEVFELPEFLVGHSSGDIGFWVASQGESAIQNCIETIYRLGSPSRRKKNPFGKIGKWLGSKPGNSDYENLLQLFRDIAAKVMAIGPKDICLGKSTERQMHSVLTAAACYKVPRQRVRQLMLDAGLIAPTSLSDKFTCFNADSAHQILFIASQMLTNLEVKDELGVQMTTVLELIESGLIKETSNTIDGRLLSIGITKSELLRFKNSIFDLAKSENRFDGYLPLNAICTKFEVSQTSIISAILEGKTKNFSLLPRARKNLACLLINVGEARAIAADNRAKVSNNLMTAIEAASYMMASRATISSLRMQGFIDVVFKTDDWREAGKDFYPQSSMDAFMETHVSIIYLAAINSTTIARVKKELLERGVKTVNTRKQGETRFYLRHEVAKFLNT